MKDARAVPAAITIVILVLLSKYAALVALLEAQNWWAIPLLPVLGRTAIIGLFLTTRYVRTGGIGETMSRAVPQPAALWITGVVAALFVFIGGGECKRWA